MSVAAIRLNHPSPTLFKIISKIILCNFIIVEVPIFLIYLSNMFIVYSTVFILNFINDYKILGFNLNLIRMIFPVVEVIILFFILSIYLNKLRYILNKINFGLRDEWMDYISSKDLKMGFYNLIVFLKPKSSSVFSFSYYIESKIVDKIFISSYEIVSLIVLFLFIFLFSLIYTSYMGKDFFGVNIWESQTLVTYANSSWINSQMINASLAYVGEAIIITMLILMFIFTFIEVLPLFIILCLFPVNSGFPDLSDVPIFFIKKTKQQLEAVDFLENSEVLQSKKDEISNTLYYSTKFVKIDKSRKYPDYMNFCYMNCCGLLSEHARDDIRFRANSLYEKMNNTLVKINHMNNTEDKNKIVNDLEMYLHVIETKNLSEIEALKFENKEVSLDKALTFFFHNMLLPFSLIIVAQIIT